jgi:hypothetical protein
VEKIGQLFRLGIWAVKPENSSEFIAAWQTFTERLAQNLPDERGAVLLEDIRDPNRFISFAPISYPEKVEEVMSRAELQELWSRLMELCEDFKPNMLRVVGAVGK